MTSISQPSMHLSTEDEVTPFETSKGEQLKVRAKKKGKGHSATRSEKKKKDKGKQFIV